MPAPAAFPTPVRASARRNLPATAAGLLTVLGPVLLPRLDRLRRGAQSFREAHARQTGHSP